MLPYPLLGWFRSGLSALVLPALMLAAAGPPLVDAGNLTADPGARLGGEVIVTGVWVKVAPSDRGYMVVILRGRGGGRVACHFEAVPASDRLGLEARLVQPGETAVRGRCSGVEDGMAVLRGCCLLD